MTMKNTKITEHNLTKIGITYSIAREQEPVYLNSYKDVKKELIKHFDQDLLEYREEFLAFYLSRKNEFLGFSQISTGATAGVIIDVKHIIQRAVLSNCSCLLVAHNHPSGCPKPSEQDKMLTGRIKQACTLFDISFIDHIIYGKVNENINLFSFAEEGLI
jgi:DNA repair protein RadC